MEISPRKVSKRAQEPVDEWLQGEGFFRKHAPRDPTCLFRAVSEQVYLTQYYHLRVRRECVEFMRNNRHLFEEYVKGPLDTHLEQMAYFTEWGGINEIQAMSLLYKREFVVFNGQKQVHRAVTNHGFKDTVYLCHTPQKQYESIYTRSFAATAAYCQSIVYQALYKEVFKMSNVETTVNKMLHDRSTVFRHHKFFLKGNLEVRDQLTVELYNKLESDENENAQYVQKTKPPFPYRVAKALDPNIYRNIEFDIWHEIRREVKSAGWNRHNSHELQVGGKCLVQIQFNDDEYDKANNNSFSLYSPETDANGNETKLVHKRTKSPVFFCGHIQEMSKNQGPVLVFIEELGEKKSVPYSALKPLPLKKNRLQFVPIYQRNVQINSSQKWKKGCNSNSKKIKETVTAINVVSNDYDKTDNRNNNVSNINKKCYALSQWNEESLKEDQQQTYEHYQVEKYNNFSMNNPPEMFASTIMIEENGTSAVGTGQEVQKDSRNVTPSFTNVSTENGNINKNTKPAPTNPECNAEFNVPKQTPQKDAYYPPYSENSNNIPTNTNPIYTTPDGNGFNHMDRMLRTINCSASKSVDENGHDLPLSDPLTLRFFYNLGLEYFRAYNTWTYPSNGQSVGFGQWYQGAPPNEAAGSLANGMQDCNITDKSDSYSHNSRSDKYLASPETSVKSANIPKDTHMPRNETPRSEPVRESYSGREKPRDHVNGNKESVRMHRNTLAPRFKRNPDYRNRNVVHSPNTPHQQTHSSHQNRGPNGHQNGHPKQQEPRIDNINSSNSPVASQPVHLPVSPTAYPPYVQQGMCVPYYGTEADAFGNPYYPPSPGFFPVPCIPHTEVHENNNIPAFQPHVYPGLDYSQGFPGVCSPFMCPPPSPCMPPQNIPEHWYALPGQPQFMQFTPVVQVPPESPCNMQNQGPNMAGSS